MSVQSILTKARELISDPAHWTQGEMARNSRGKQEAACSGAAVKWCALGAIIRMADEPLVEKRTIIALTRLLRGSIANYGSIADYNDTHSHSEVLALLDAAIASFTAQGDQPPA